MSAPPPPPDPRPGCYDRAWNDPPLFSYQNAEASKPGTKFNKRVGFPSAAGAPAPPASGGTLPLSVPPPPPTNLQPPPKSAVLPSSKPSGQPPKPAGQPPKLPTAEQVTTDLTSFLEERSTEIGERKASDIAKRVAVMREKWDGLSDHVKWGMHAVAVNLRESQFDQAEKIQKTLVVDWPSQCGTWMVGIKHLIQEARKISQNPTDPSQTDPSQTNPSETDDRCCDEGYLIPVETPLKN